MFTARTYRLFVVATVAALALTGLVYLGWSVLLGGEAGFSLDDGWIHQTFARSIARTGQMAYNPGEPAAGSTAPLWTLLLSAGYLLPVDYRLWAYLLGLACLGGSAWLVFALARQLWPAERGVAVLAAGLTLVQWHLAWAALSGMETSLFVLLSLALVYLTLRGSPALAGGAIAGLLITTRPEGAILALLCFVALSVRAASAPGTRWLRPLLWLLAVAIVLAPYVAFTWSASGTVLPNTFFAKTVQTGGLPSAQAVLGFLGGAAGVLSPGLLALLAPGLVLALWLTVRQRRDVWLVWAWPLALVAVYAWRLPTLYHHGRYLMPVLPWLILLGCWGLVMVSRRLSLRLLPKTYLGLLLAVTVGYWGFGAYVYAWDVRYINITQVRAAHWLQAQTPAGSLVATHDIGAIGYFSGRRLVDMAGLITPEAAPLVRDQAALMAFVQARHADYVAQFPSWYPQIAQALAGREVARFHDDQVAAAGGDDLVIYETGWR